MTNDSKFVLHTDAGIRALYEKLGADKLMLCNEDHQKLSLTSGFNYHPRGLILHAQVQVASQALFDWPHVYCAGGVLDTELGWS